MPDVTLPEGIERLLSIPKSSGGTRLVVVPTEERKAQLRALCGRLEAKARQACPVAHGFIRGRSPVSNALEHVGHKWTVGFDLRDFFGSVDPQRHLRGKLTAQEAALVLVDIGDGRGPRPHQGLPTSPSVANLAAIDLDRAILRSIERHGKNAIYTRYADDLTFSGDDYVIRDWVLREVPQIVARCGFRVAERKTRVCDERAGRREVTGVMVDATGVHVPREIKRRLRAAKHRAETDPNPEAKQRAANSARGLEEWAKMRPPKPLPDPSTLSQQEQDEAREAERRSLQAKTDTEIAERLRRTWRLGDLPTIPQRDSTREVVDGDFIITRDPAYVLGCSTFTTGWRSCLGQPSGQYRQGVRLWMGLAGTSVGAVLSTTTATHGGIERRVMRARCWVHHIRGEDGGGRYYDRVYGDEDSAQELIEWLRRQGVQRIEDLRSGKRVIGNVATTDCAKPYFDRLRAVKAKAKGRAVWVVCK